MTLLMAIGITMPPVSAQRGGKGGGGSTQPSLLRPVIIGHAGSISGGAQYRYNAPPTWLDLIDTTYAVHHPDQMTETGSNRALIAAVSAVGDLSHGGGSRYVLDVREAAAGGKALIAAPESAGSLENPTWYYDGPGGDDDTHDRILVNPGEFDVNAGRWSRDGSRVAFQATSIGTGQSGIWIADVVLSASGQPYSIANIVLVALGGTHPRWGGNRLAFMRNLETGYTDHMPGPGDGFVVDVSVPTAPIETVLGRVTSPPDLSSDGNIALYSKVMGDRWDLIVRDLSNGAETRITDQSRVPEPHPAYPTFSPDNQRIVFSTTHACFSTTGCRSLAVIDVIGSSRRTMISTTFTLKVGQGRNSRQIEVGSLWSAIWRR